MFPPKLLIVGYLLPAVIAAAGVVLAGSLAKGRWLVLALALGLAALIGLTGAGDWPDFPPLEAWGWTHYGVALAALIGLVEAILPLPIALRWGLRLLLAQALVGLILRPLVPHIFEVDGAAFRWMGLELGVLFAWANLDAYASREPGPALPGVLAMVAGTIAAALIISGSLRLGQFALIFTAITVAWTFAAMVRSAMTWEGVSLAVPVAAWASLLLNGTFYAELPEVSVALFAAAPLLAWITRIGPIRRLGGRNRALIATFAVALPAVAAVLLAIRQSPSFE